MEFWFALKTNPFLSMALFAGLAAAFASGIVGPYVVSKRIVFISGSISHAVLGGIGIFVFLNYITGLTIFNPLIGSLVSAIFFGFIIGASHLYYKEREDTVIAAIWSFGMAIGVIFIAVVPNTNTQLMDFLFGNLLWAGPSELKMLLALDAFVLLVCLICHKRFLAISFDETQSYLQKQPVTFIYFILLTLVAITVVLMIQTIGAILVIAMLCLPAAVANLFTRQLSKMICLSVILSLFFTFIGIYLSYSFNWPPGATIALATALIYFLSLPLKNRSI
ncbi:MAG: metal ABC transporter permease [Chlamydiae bacterium]|nr:metal ABC transporter permease [Chlamydiota bacterium]